jgi:hypothetical protein
MQGAASSVPSSPAIGFPFIDPSFILRIIRSGPETLKAGRIAAAFVI